MTDFLELSRRLRDGLVALGAVDDPAIAPRPSIAVARDDILVDLRLKALPELERPGTLPVFVGIQGGTNVGKSTMLNALAGQVLSPAAVQASATKHPLVFAHRRWRSALIESDALVDLDRRELSDPKELLSDEHATELVYFRFHNDDELAPWAVIDSPDFDSALESNAIAARYVSALSDITVFVTSTQKYKDRALVDRLRALIGRKSLVLVVLNMLDEDIVFRTVLDDLRTTLGPGFPVPLAIRIPHVAGAYPEDAIRETLAPEIWRALGSSDAAEIKASIVRRTLASIVADTASLSALLAEELRFKADLEQLLATRIETAVGEYRREFALSLPEETLAIRRIIGLTELWPWLRISRGVERANAPLRLFGSFLERSSDAIRHTLLRMLRRDEGAIDDSLEAAREYAVTRDKTDLENIARDAIAIRHEVETFCRDHEERSSLARSLIPGFFGNSEQRDFTSSLRSVFRAELDDRPISAESIYERVRSWTESHRRGVRLLTIAGIAAKAGAGVLVAWLLPPEGIFDLFTIGQFAGGWIAAAYLLALVSSLAIRAKKRFEAARIENARAVLEKTLVLPLREFIDAAIRRGDHDALAGAVAELETALRDFPRGPAHPGRGATSRGHSRPCR